MLGIVVLLLYGFALLVIVAALARVAPTEVDEPDSMGLAGWDEDVDLRKRFGDDWNAYRAAVPPWIPRWRPFVREGPPSRLYVSETCGMCREVGEWFSARAARDLVIVAAESHPSQSLTRITYETGDGSARDTGIAAVARALEHVHVGWACLGFALRLPLMRPVVQRLIDVSGGQPRRVSAGAMSRRSRTGGRCRSRRVWG